MRLSDTTGHWAFAGDVTLRAARGDFEQNETALNDVLAHPLMTNMLRGRLQLLLGNVDLAIQAWEEVEPSLRSVLWRYASGGEKFYAPNVVESQKYRLLLEDIGVGASWKMYLRMRVAELSPLTGVQLATAPSTDDELLYAWR